MPCAKQWSYPVIAVPHVFDSPQSPLALLLRDRRALLVTTPTVYALYGDSVREFSRKVRCALDVLVLSVDEESKTHSSVERICRKTLELGLDRQSILIALGGGVCSDLTSHAASLIRRGIGCVRIPTTLLGQVDAALGVKNSVNFEGKKSYLGSFYPPMAVLLDPTFLRTLPSQHFQLGLAEIIKIALVCDAELFELVEAEWSRFVATSFEAPNRGLYRIIELSARRMLEELADNLFEDRTHKRLVDAGHTFSPQIEIASRFTIPHGAAVAIDLSLSTTIAAVARLLTWNERDRVIGLIRTIGLPIYTELLTEDLCERALIEARRHRSGEANLVLPVRVGSGIFAESGRDFDSRILSTAIDKLRSDDRVGAVRGDRDRCGGSAPGHWNSVTSIGSSE